MSVSEIGALHARYVRLSDRFKSCWTYHQFAAGVYKNFLEEEVPYKVDFARTYEQIKAVAGTLNESQMLAANGAIATCDVALDRAAAQLLHADQRIGPSALRRFFEKLKKTDDNIIHCLIKFYLYADAVEGDRRDKLDFLFTRIGEDSRESLEFRERIIALVSVLRVAEAPREEVVRVIGALRSMRDEVRDTPSFDTMTEGHLLKNARTFKHRIGDLYFHPDVLLAIVELNVTTKSRFRKLYQSEEPRLMEDAEKLMEHGTAIERNFGETNPELMEEIARFREVKELFDASRAQSNVKADVIASLKSSMTNILAQLDRGLGNDVETADLPATFFNEAEREENLADRFGREEALLRFLERIGASLDGLDAEIEPELLAEMPAVRELRLEPWEISSYHKLFGRRAAESDEDNEELWMLYLRAAALRIKVDEEATILATAMAAGVRPEGELLAKAKHSLDFSKELDEHFGDFLHEAVYYSNPKILHQLYRSRFRLLRGFSGLWLIYDRGNS